MPTFFLSWNPWKNQTTLKYSQVGTLASGEIDYEELRARLAANVARPAIINVNIGTTVRGAVDDLDRVLAILQVRRCLV